MKSDRPVAPKGATRKERLAQALRANLKRRKQQSRGRAEAEKPAPKAHQPAGENKE